MAESRVLAEACADPSPSIVSVAGGAVLSADNRRFIAASGIVVWLRARPETLAARVGDGVGRPLLGEDPSTALTQLLAVRNPLYAELADVILDVDDLTPAVVADRIVDAVDASADMSGDLDTPVNPAPGQAR
jgi:shikimate kinase